MRSLFLAPIFLSLFSFACTSLSTETQSTCMDGLGFDSCRPFRVGVTLLAPAFDAVKPLGTIDESGWTLASDLLIGAVNDEWVGAYQLKTKSFAWWFKVNESLTAPVEIFGSWAILPLRDGRLIKVETQTGKQVWEARLSHFVSTKSVVSGNVLLALSTDQKLFAFDFQTGQNLWVYDSGTGASILMRNGAGPVVSGAEVFIGTSDGDIRSISLSTGKENWKLGLGREDFRFKDIVGEIGLGNHQIYVTRYDGIVSAIDTTRQASNVLWKENFASITTSLYRDGTLYVACINGDLIALQASSGRQIWKSNLGQSIKSLTLGEKAIFAGGSQGRITAVANNSGQILWHDDLQGALSRQPVVVDEQIYFSTGLKALYSYKIM
ncbi:MAG: PQQ-binding-like beta-propeller repeat protein [Proteobacteria bacterium]|nr:PQQ-binding-like beta-propeller repeat protein [Pseudomonadota bacterium]